MKPDKTYTNSRIRPLLILAAVVGLTAWAAATNAFSFSSQTKDDYNPTPACEDYSSYKEIQKSFPLLLDQDVEILLVTSLKGSDVLTNTTAAIFSDMQDNIRSSNDTTALLGMESYFTFADGPLASIGQEYVSPDRSSAFLAVRLDTAKEGVNDLVTSAHTYASQLNTTYTPQGYSVIMTGRLTAQAVAQKSTGIGFAIADGSGLPFIVVIFWLQVGSARLLIIPGIALACSLILSYSAGALIAAHTALNIPSYQPNIMLFLCLALSIDYSFFLLTRLQEERKKGEPYEHAVWTSLRQSGKTVLVSGGILVITWFALIFFPVYGLDSIGYCSSITVAFCMVVNLLVCPSLLLAFPGFFDGAGFSMLSGLRRCCCCYACGRRDPQSERGYLDISAVPPTLSGDGRPSNSTLLLPFRESEGGGTSRSSKNGGGGGDGPRRRNCYHGLGSVVTRRPWNIVAPLVVFAVLAAGAYQLRDLNLSLAANIDFGTGPEAKAYGEVLSTYRTPLLTTPFTVLLTTKNENTVLDPKVFAFSCALATELAARVPDVVIPAMSGVAFAPAFAGLKPDSKTPVFKIDCVNETLAEQYIGGEAPAAPTSKEAEVYRYRWEEEVNTRGARNSSTTMSLTPSFNPFSTRSRDFVKAVRAVLDGQAAAAQAAGVETWFFHPMVTEVDAEAFTFSRFPVVLSVAMLLAFLLIAVRFRAAFIPLKLALTIALPILFLFGAAVWVYQVGGLDGLHIGALSSTRSKGISWLIPCSTIFVLIGLALDYDIFLFSRVYELRRKGQREPGVNDLTRSAIIQAVEVTGPVISGAGVICALAFLGMLVNTNAFLNQFGFIMILGILLDTFVVRVVLVPSLLSIGDKINFWPTRMPDEFQPAGGVSPNQKLVSQGSYLRV